MDVDSTLITAEVIELLAEHAGTREQVAEVTERAMRGELDFAASLRERVATLAGLDVAVLEEVRVAVELSAGARELVAAVQERGGRVGLVSGGFLEVVGPLAAELGIDHVEANRLEVDGGRLTGRTTGPVVDRAAKERHLRAWAQADGVPLARVVAVGDGANDLDMLAAAGLGVAYCAKPVVQEQARAAVTFPRLDAVLGLLGG
ncbi:phosphoserine phosphatase SerB [Georgenia sp. 311]|nr:phosphoserine phosphatase SerB [Georgenia sp. 311]